MHALLVLEGFAHSLPHGESLVRKLTTALLEKVFFSQFISLHCHLSLCISQMAPLYQSKTSFISNPLIVYLQPFSLSSFNTDRLSPWKCCSTILHLLDFNGLLSCTCHLIFGGHFHKQPYHLVSSSPALLKSLFGCLKRR